MVQAPEVVCGCTDETACNYNSEANNEADVHLWTRWQSATVLASQKALDCDGTLPACGYDCDGVCILDEDNDGICDCEDECLPGTALMSDQLLIVQ